MDGAQARIRNPAADLMLAVCELEVAAVVVKLPTSAGNEQWMV